jgi:RNA polymerase sigma-54 factor
MEMLKDKGATKEVRDFVRNHVENASALIDAIRFRRERLLAVAQIIVDRQRDFFDVGPEGLKVLRMSDLAEELQCDPSTISRTVAGKYVQTVRGIFPLRYFFSGGTQTADGESTSWDSVKASVQKIVAEEDKTNPLRDDQIAAMLSSKGVDISRRTVAKYRQQLNIPPARQRRQF